MNRRAFLASLLAAPAAAALPREEEVEGGLTVPSEAFSKYAASRGGVASPGDCEIVALEYSQVFGDMRARMWSDLVQGHEEWLYGDLT